MKKQFLIIFLIIATAIIGFKIGSSYQNYQDVKTAARNLDPNCYKQLIK